MQISYSDFLGDTPAIVHRSSGKVLLNRKMWIMLPQAFRHFILAHEIGHYVRNTSNELEADHFAFHQTAGRFPRSLKSMVNTLFEVLPFKTESQQLRLMNIYRLGLCYDYHKNPTERKRKDIHEIEAEMMNYNENPELKNYMKATKGKITDYFMPPYNPAIFDPSIGRYFHDVPIDSGSQKQAPWESNCPNTLQQPVQTIPGNSPTFSDNIGSEDSVPLTVLTDKIPFEIDWKSVAIGILLILAIIGISKI